MTAVFLLQLRTSAPRVTVYLKNAIVGAPVLQVSPSSGVVVALVVGHADP